MWVGKWQTYSLFTDLYFLEKLLTLLAEYNARCSTRLTGGEVWGKAANGLALFAFNRTNSDILSGSFEVNSKTKGVVYLSKYATYRYEVKQRDETRYEGSF